jgi:hypothetical protein
MQWGIGNRSGGEEGKFQFMDADMEDITETCAWNLSEKLTENPTFLLDEDKEQDSNEISVEREGVPASTDKEIIHMVLFDGQGGGEVSLFFLVAKGLRKTERFKWCEGCQWTRNLFTLL